MRFQCFEGCFDTPADEETDREPVDDDFIVVRTQQPIKNGVPKFTDGHQHIGHEHDGDDDPHVEEDIECCRDKRDEETDIILYDDDGNEVNFCFDQVFTFGDGGINLKAEGQDFVSLRDACLEEGTLFEDPDFLAEDSSIFFSKTPPKPFEWKRPHEMVPDPKLFIDGASRFDVKQGDLGNCWLLAAIANLTLNEKLFYQIVPPDQSFEENYAGIFHFRFWQYGRWIDVVIDDRLPTFYGKLVFVHSEEYNEFWSALLEKAYAKLHGSYESLRGGLTSEAMTDFTGGVTEMFELATEPRNLFGIMEKAHQRKSLMGCSIPPDPKIVEARQKNGLVKGHAYSITAVQYCDIETPRVSGKIPLVRIRNPWGNEAEWKGAWSDKSKEWEFIPEEEKQKMGLTFDHDGEFWMSYKDFMTEFHNLEITNLSPDMDDDETAQKWEVGMYEGSWIKGSTAGGCRNFLKSFWRNPQYRITLSDVDDDDPDGKCTVIIALMQKNRRSQREDGLKALTIGFAVYRLENPDNLPRPLNMNFFKYNATVARSPSFINMREVSGRYHLEPGTYCIVPSTFDPQENGEFILRVYSEKPNVIEENDKEVGFGPVDERLTDEGQAEELDEQTKEVFTILAGDDSEVDYSELQNLINHVMTREFECEGFSKEFCGTMIAMMDADETDKLGLEEFVMLWGDIRTWKKCFKLFDEDSSGYFSNFELRTALASCGYRLNNHLCDALMKRYGDEEARVYFDDFIMCSVRLRTKLGRPGDSDSPSSEAVQNLLETLQAEVEQQVQ